MSAGLKTLIRRRDDLIKQIDSLNIRLDEINSLIDSLQNRERQDLASALNVLLEQAGDAGLTVNEAVEKADLNKGSVAATLSKMKSAGLVTKRGARYIKASSD